jgi:hypothetical protein
MSCEKREFLFVLQKESLFKPESFQEFCGASQAVYQAVPEDFFSVIRAATPLSISIREELAHQIENIYMRYNALERRGLRDFANYSRMEEIDSLSKEELIDLFAQAGRELTNLYQKEGIFQRQVNWFGEIITGEELLSIASRHEVFHLGRMSETLRMSKIEAPLELMALLPSLQQERDYHLGMCHAKDEFGFNFGLKLEQVWGDWRARIVEKRGVERVFKSF